MTLAFVAPPARVDASSSGGNIVVVLPDRPVAYRVHASGQGGSTDTPIRTDPNGPNVINAESRGGDVSIRYADG